MVTIIVLRPSPVQGPSSVFWLDHRVGRASSFFFKSKQRRFSNNKKKTKKNQRVCNRILPGQPAGSYRVFSSPFFLQPGLVPASGWPGSGSTCRAGPSFKTIVTSINGNFCKLEGWVEKFYTQNRSITLMNQWELN